MVAVHIRTCREVHLVRVNERAQRAIGLKVDGPVDGAKRPAHVEVYLAEHIRRPAAVTLMMAEVGQKRTVTAFERGFHIVGLISAFITGWNRKKRTVSEQTHCTESLSYRGRFHAGKERLRGG